MGDTQKRRTTVRHRRAWLNSVAKLKAGARAAGRWLISCWRVMGAMLGSMAFFGLLLAFLHHAPGLLGWAKVAPAPAANSPAPEASSAQKAASAPVPKVASSPLPVAASSLGLISESQNDQAGKKSTWLASCGLEGQGLSGNKSLGTGMWHPLKGKSMAEVAVPQAAASELILNKHGQVERASVRDPGMLPVCALSLAMQAESHREMVANQLLGSLNGKEGGKEKDKDKKSESVESLSVVVFWSVASVLLFGFFHASFSAIRGLFGSHHLDKLLQALWERVMPGQADEKPAAKGALTSSVGAVVLSLGVSVLPWLALAGALGFGVYRAYPPTSTQALDPQVTGSLSQLANSSVDRELIQLARQSLTLNQEGDQAALNAALVAKLTAQGADVAALAEAVKSTHRQLAEAAQQAAQASKTNEIAAHQMAAAASSGAMAATHLDAAASQVASAATSASAASANNAETMGKLMVLAKSTTQNLSLLSKEVSYLSDVTVRADGVQKALPKPVVVLDTKDVSKCLNSAQLSYEVIWGDDGLWLQSPVRCKP